jgi:hypothetical protein
MIQDDACREIKLSVCSGSVPPIICFSNPFVGVTSTVVMRDEEATGDGSASSEGGECLGDVGGETILT